MKYNTLIATFKNGLCSPLVRGRKDIEGIDSSAEEFQNNWIDSIGATRRRKGLNVSLGYIDNASSTDTVQNFAFKLLGVSYLFSFNKRYAFNEVDTLGTAYPQYLRIDGGARTNVQVFGADSSGSSTMPRMRAFNTSLGGVDSSLEQYLNQYLTIIQYTQISDRTVVFTTDSFPFAVSLVDTETKDIGPNSRPVRTFIMYPYFVNLQALLKNGTFPSAVPYANPMYCTNYPFNFTNTSTSTLVFLLEQSGQTGSLTTPGILTTDDMKFVRLVDIPLSIIPDTLSSSFFTGAYIRIKTVDSKEAVFFLTFPIPGTITRSGVEYQRYRAIQTVGGEINALGESFFTISTWNLGAGFPKVCGTYLSRLLFANSGNDNTSTVFAAAINNSSPLDYQGMMADTLIQDASTSDVSGMLYFDSANANRRGFSLSFSDGNGQEIRWMGSRRRLHLGTSSGEYQITVDRVFSRDTAAQIRFGSINSDFIQPADGDRKIIYSANNGSELRAISVEDRDYESVDIKLSTILSGLPFKIEKMQWFEKMRILLILTPEKKVYALSLDSNTQVAGFSPWLYAVNVDDICATTDICYIIYNALSDYSGVASDIKAIGIQAVDDNTDSTEQYPVDDRLHLDSFLSYTFSSDVEDIRYVAINIVRMIGDARIVFYTEGVVCDVGIVTSSMVDTDITLSAEFLAAQETGKPYVVGVPYKSRIRALPQYQGSQYGSPVGDVHRIDRVTVQCYKSGKFKYGSLDTPLYASEGLASGLTATKDYTYELPQSSDREQFFVIETDECTPLNISGVALRGLSNSGE